MKNDRITILNQQMNGMKAALFLVILIKMYSDFLT